jgi:hypothetical protein
MPKGDATLRLAAIARAPRIEDCLSSKTVMGSAAAVEQASFSETLSKRAERGSGAAPRQLVHVTEQVRVGPQSRQILEEEGQTAALSQHGRREVLEPRSRWKL